MALPAEKAAEANIEVQDAEDPGEIDFDDALTNIGLGWGQGLSMCVMSLLWFGENMQLFAMFYLTKALRDEWKTPASTVALLDSLLFVGVAVGAIIGGTCSDYFGRKPTVLWSAFLTTCFGFYNAYANSFQELCVLRLMLGLSLGIFGPASMSMTLETCPQEQRGKYVLAVPGFSGAAGKIAVALLADALYDSDYNSNYVRFTWRAFLVLCTLPTFFGLCLGVYVLSESPRWLLVMRREAEAQTILTNLALKNSNAAAFPKGTRLHPAPVSNSDGIFFSFQRIFQEHVIFDTFLASMSMVLFALVYYGLIYVLPIYLGPWALQNGWTDHQLNMGLVLVAMSELPAVAAMMLTVDLANVGRRHSVAIAAAGTSLSCILINFRALVALFRSSFGILGSNFLARGFAQAAFLGSTLYMGEMFPTSARGAAISVAITSGRVGAAIAPLVASQLILNSNTPSSLGMWSALDPLRVYVFFALVAAGAAAFFLAIGPWEPAGAPLLESPTVRKPAAKEESEPLLRKRSWAKE